MRIAVVTWNCRQVGGVETYLATVLPAIAARDHQLAILCETAQPSAQPMIELPPETPIWRSEALGAAATLDRLRRWQPDLIFCHGLHDITLEQAVAAQAPSIFYAHNYYGCCISGSKSFGLPRTRLCSRRFGWPCLMQFYPRRCGGLNPITMARLYHREARHRKLLLDYSKSVTASEHMRQEYLGQGFHQEAVRMIPPPVAESGLEGEPHSGSETVSSSGLHDEWRLLFLGRMVSLKGGEVLLNAMPEVAAKVSCPLRLVFAGDGPARARWENHAARLRSRIPNLTIELRGWLSGSAYTTTLADTHLLVMPSLWPEPFGRAGLEAGVHGIPTAAFAVGGIPEWLCDGINGHLASGDPPTASGLADAIWRCLADRDHFTKLCDGAWEQARHFDVKRHTDELCKLFEEVVAQ
jgi:glycosyltransferase involved in cell wall biosynthesis